MLYQDGKTEVQKGDKVLGDKIKGTVAGLGKSTVQVRIRAPYDPRNGNLKTILVERDPAALELVHRG